MSPEDPDDQPLSLRRALEPLKRADERAAPSFDSMWRARGRTRRTPRAVVALGWAAPLAAAAGLVVWGLGRSQDAAAPPLAANRARPAVSTPAPPALPPLDLDFLLDWPRG